MADRLPLPEPVHGFYAVPMYTAEQMHAYADAQSAADDAELRRWKSTNAPRLEALQGLLEHAQIEAAKGSEATASLASERAANAILTGENELLTTRVKALEDALRMALAELDELPVWSNTGHVCNAARAALGDKT